MAELLPDAKFPAREKRAAGSTGAGIRTALVLGLSLALGACVTQLPDEVAADGRHLQAEAGWPTTSRAGPGIPAIVDNAPLLSAPQPGNEPQLYTIVAQDVPIRELLFTMARDAGINVDVNPDVSGRITINAIEQTLPQILQRIARQADIRWFVDASDNLVVEADSPVWRTYTVDYVNVSRTADTQAQISTSIVNGLGTQGGGQQGGINNSQASLTQSFANNFWATLTANLRSLLGETDDMEGSSAIVSNPETGLLSVHATTAQHSRIAGFINSVQSRSLHQVLIEATIVEVRLSDDYQSGVDWDTLGTGDNTEVYFAQNLIGSNLASSPFNVLAIDRSTAADPIRATIRMLSKFGELRVLSSPKIMTLNNQAAMLRVVDNEVYFNVEVEPGVVSGTGAATTPTYTTNINTVPVGFVMTVTPQVSDDNQVTLNVRPTISRIVDFTRDPNPILADAGIINEIPKIQVREFESILKVYDGQIAILGGLMEDSVRNNTEGLPGLSRLPLLRSLFSYRSDLATKTELIIFIRPVVVRQPSLSGDLHEYRQFLPVDGLGNSSALTPNELLTQ